MKSYRVRVAVTHVLTEEALRGLWRYRRGNLGGFSVRKAIALARELLSDNPELEVQISEGLEWIANDERERRSPRNSASLGLTMLERIMAWPEKDDDKPGEPESRMGGDRS